MSIPTSSHLFYSKLSQPLLHPKPLLFKTLILSVPQTLSFSKSISTQNLPTKIPHASPPQSPPSSPLQPIQELPPKLQEIINLFQAVQETKAKHKQLLFYGKNLKPLETRFKTSENKVQGCVSQVWVRACLDSDKNVVFEADSDSGFTKGLAALLVLGLSGRPVEEILRVSPDFVVLLGQSLTPSRNNGFLNMLKLMQKKALEVYMEAEKGSDFDIRDENLVEGSNLSSKNGIGAEKDSDFGMKDENPVEDSNSGSRNGIGGGDLVVRVSSEVSSDDLGSNLDGRGVGLGSRGERIREKLESELRPVELQVEDISYQHAGHEGVRGSDGETHFNVKVVSKEFEGKSLVKRHRLVYQLLQDELQSGLHALSIVAKTPSEVGSR
ncbi:hypothetical protein RHGRI_018809 [Rhododendron griersonianum]|uniref:Fe-S metabolism associated domain-containing protein n=1 Tax=Rhododendron griersonianum TaxID=479676 RepID=A0AAV6K307_9ERIC|nr:hypothetical protein RHGRI_018809 [Rhododendron griersonianum]